MNTNMRSENGPLVASLAILAGMLILLLCRVHQMTNGHFCYPLDDTFIHLSVAKHLALDYSWGINTNEYSASSSSPMYTLLLALLMRMGFRTLSMPFWLNVLMAVWLLVLINRYLKQKGLRPATIFCILQAIVWLAPLPVLIFVGMEHILHSVLVLLLIQQTIKSLQRAAGPRMAIYTGLAAAFAILTRFETLFILAPVILLFLYYKRFKQVIWVLLVALLPVLTMGLLSLYYGAYMLPNSVLLKGWVYGNSTLPTALLSKLMHILIPTLAGRVLLGLLLLLLMILIFTKTFSNRDNRSRESNQLAFIWGTSCILHLLFAKVGWLFRYEAWLVVTGIFVIGQILKLQGKQIKAFLQGKWLFVKIAVFLFVASTILPLFQRAFTAITNTPLACKNIYEQQFQIAMFLQQYYHHYAIGANDIGAISYYGDNNIVDLWGIGSNEVAASKLKNYYTTQFLRELIQRKNIKIIVVYEDWFPPDLWLKWIKLATWRINNNIICGGSEVSFYVTDSTFASPLLTNLKAFGAHLPPGAAATYYGP